MNELAFIIGTVVAVSYYFYSVRKERKRSKEQSGQEESTPNQPKGGDNQ